MLDGPLTNEAPTSRLLVRALFVAVSTSALGGTRTPNLLIRSQMLYPLSYERRWNPSSLGGAERTVRAEGA